MRQSRQLHQNCPAATTNTEPHSAPLRRLLAQKLGVPERLIHINAGSELILRQIFDRFGQQVHLLTPTYPLFPEVSRNYTETRLRPEENFRFDLNELKVPDGTTLVAIVNPNNPNGLTFNVDALPALLVCHPEVRFLVDEAFIGLAGVSIVHLVSHHTNLLVTRTLSKAHSLAGFRVGYAILPEAIADDLNDHNDAYPLARPSEAAAIATLQHEHKITARAAKLKAWTRKLAGELETLGVRTFPSDTYFFLADFAPHDAGLLARQLADRKMLVKPLNDIHFGPGYMRITTALPDDNARFVAVLRELLCSG